jgi:hypothetical protein
MTEPSARACGSCSLCCKTMDVAALSKPAGAWCKFCTVNGQMNGRVSGKGCSQHMLRPKQCREFQCVWLMDGRLGPEWKPDTAKFVLASEYGGRVLSVMVDAKQPNAWKSEPYRRVLKEMTVRQMSEGKIVMIVTDTKRYIMLPDTEAELGPRDMVYDWVIQRSETPDGPHFDVEITRGAKAA